MKYTSSLARFCADLAFGDLPLEVVDIARSCIMDFVGCVLGSLRMEEEIKRLGRFVHGLGERQESTVLGLGLKTSCRGAALAHGAMADILELQDTYGYAGLHLSTCVLPAAFSLAEMRRSSGKELLTAVVAGYEVAIRIGAAVGMAPMSRGFIPAGTVGSFGAAMAAGKLLGLDAPSLTHCLGITGFLLPFSMAENTLLGRTVKPIHGGLAARAGVEAALLAAQGYTASEFVLEGSAPSRPWGFCSIAGGQVDLERLSLGLGQMYEMRDIAFKVFPCCGMAQAAVGATLELVREHHLRATAIQDVVVRTVGAVVSRVGQHYPIASSSFTECQFSLPYLLAAGIKHGQLGLEQLTAECIRDPEILDLSARVKVVEDPGVLSQAQPGARPAVVEVYTREGERLTARVDFRKGDRRNPITEAELLAKFEGLASCALGREAIEHCKGMLLALDAVADFSALVEVCRAPGKSVLERPVR